MYEIPTLSYTIRCINYKKYSTWRDGLSGQKRIRLKVVTLDRFEKGIHHNLAKKFKLCSLIFNWKFNILISLLQESIYEYILHNFLKRRLALNKLNSNLNTLDMGLWMTLEEKVKNKLEQ